MAICMQRSLKVDSLCQNIMSSTSHILIVHLIQSRSQQEVGSAVLMPSNPEASMYLMAYISMVRRLISWVLLLCRSRAESVLAEAELSQSAVQITNPLVGFIFPDCIILHGSLRATNAAATIIHVGVGTRHDIVGVDSPRVVKDDQKIK